VKDDSSPRLNPAAALLALSALLAVLIGGYVESGQVERDPASILSELFVGNGVRGFQHVIIAAPILLVTAFGLFRRRVQQVPKQHLATALAAFFLFIGLPCLIAANKAHALEVWFEWLTYGCALFAVVANVGRQRGPLILLGAIAVGCLLIASFGVQEYGDQRLTHPDWRIFAHTQDPNVAAAMLLPGIFISFIFVASERRIVSFISILGGGLALFALLLTGSKGGTSLGLPIGLLALGATLVTGPSSKRIAFLAGAFVLALAEFACFVRNVAWAGLGVSLVYLVAAVMTLPDGKKTVPRLAGPFVVCSVFLLLLTVTSRPPAAQARAEGQLVSPVARVTQGANTAEQSATFRLNLWRSTLALIKLRPFTGYGLGSYAVESSRSGRVTPTVLAHETYLQLGAECGVLPLLLFLYCGCAWFKAVWRGQSELPTGQRLQLAAVIAAVTALLAHSLIDSDLYYYGIGVVFFMLLGVGLLLASDAVTPELAQSKARVFVGAGSIGLLILLIVSAYIDTQKAFIKQDLAKQNRQDMEADVAAIGWTSGFDGETDYYSALLAQGPEQINELKQALALAPSPRYGRALSDAQLRAGQTTGAVASLLDALDYDPNNLPALLRLAKLYQTTGDTDKAVETAQRLVRVEKSPYFTARSLPEIVPTETYLARIEILAPNSSAPKQKADYLAEGVRGIAHYLKETVWRIVQSQKGGDTQPLVYGSAEEAQEILATGAAAAIEAAKLYRTMGDAKDAAEMEADAPLLVLPTG